MSYAVYENCPAHGSLHPRGFCEVQTKPRAQWTAAEFWPLCMACGSSQTTMLHGKVTCVDCGALQSNCNGD